jgi:hypothetical protein
MAAGCAHLSAWTMRFGNRNLRSLPANLSHYLHDMETHAADGIGQRESAAATRRISKILRIRSCKQHCPTMCNSTVCI